jgi:hypothetical protein
MAEDVISLAAVWLRLVVLEERIAGVVRGEDSREARLVAVEMKIDGLLEKMDVGEKAAWARFLTLVVVVLGATIGVAVYIGQMLLQHISAAGGVP